MSQTKVSKDNRFLDLIDKMETETENESRQTKTQTASDANDSRRPVIKRTRKTYGKQYSYLTVQAEEDHQVVELQPETTNESQTETLEEKLTHKRNNLTSLKMHGEFTQFKDELEFLLEGIETSSNKLVTLIELANGLFRREFLSNIKRVQLPKIYKMIDLDDLRQVYLTGFIYYQIGSWGCDIEFDFDLENVVKLLFAADIQNEGDKKFSDLRQRIGVHAAFLGASLLLQIGPVINEGLIIASLPTLDRLVADLSGSSDNIRTLEMLLILYERFVDVQQINALYHIINRLCGVLVEDENCLKCLLKLFIKLSLKNYKINSKLIASAGLLDCFETTDICLLKLSLLTTLNKDEHWCEEMARNADLLIAKFDALPADSIQFQYYSILVGTLLLRDAVHTQLTIPQCQALHRALSLTEAHTDTAKDVILHYRSLYDIHRTL